MIRNLLLSVLLAAASSALPAQTIDRFKTELAQPRDGVCVTVVEHGDAPAAIDRAERALTGRRFEGYRINIYTGNDPRAREEAAKARESFEANFAGTPVHTLYENPYFKVLAGCYATAEEAIMQLERIRRVFPKAFSVRETITASDLIEEAHPSVPAI